APARSAGGRRRRSGSVSRWRWASPSPASFGGEGDGNPGGEARVGDEPSDRGPEPLGRDLHRVLAPRDRDGTGQKFAGGAERPTVEDHLGLARRGVDDEEALLIGLEPPAAVFGRGGAGGNLLGRGGRHRRTRAGVRRVGAVRSRLRDLSVSPPALGPPLADERPASLQVAVADRAVEVEDRLLHVLV